MSFDEIKKLESIVKDALEALYRDDYYLIQNDAHERSIVFRFGIYFDDLIKLNYEGYIVDAEYNRNMHEPKRLLNHSNGVYPDIIVHKRGSNDSNLLVIEFKKSESGRVNSSDITKIKAFMDPNGVYKYKFGLFVGIGTQGYLIQWIHFNEE